MPHSVTSYLLFLAEAATIVLLVALLVGGAIALTAVLSHRRRQSPLRVRDLGERYDELGERVARAVLPRAVVKANRKTARAQQKRRRRAKEPSTRPRVFVLDFHGDVRASRVSGLRQEVTAVLSLATPSDEVVVRLQNPGGLVNDQGLAASQLLRVRRHGVPLTVCVDTVAASGGYLMACVADRIVAAPFAVIGSIGVVAQVPNFYRLLDRLGIDVEQFTGGEFKRTVTAFGQTTDADRAKLTDQIHQTHDLFKDFVAEQRPQVDLATVATGEYWYGTQALALNLVDILATSDEYLLTARERADLYEIGSTVPLSRVRQLTSAARSLVQRTGDL